jgi:hypothetical protein
LGGVFVGVCVLTSALAGLRLPLPFRLSESRRFHTSIVRRVTNPCQGSAYGSVEDSNSPPVGPLSGGREETKMPAPAARGEPSGALAAQVWRASVSPGVRTRHSHCGVCSPGSVGIVLLVVTNQIAPHVATKSCHEVFEPLRCRLQRPDPTMTHAITAHTTLQEFHHQSP